MLALWRMFWPPKPYEAHLPQRIESAPDLLLVAEADRQVVGTVTGGFDGWWAWLYRVAVHPDHQRHTTGERLIREIQARLKARGAGSAGMVVNAENERMTGLLGRLGYRHDERHGVFGTRFAGDA